MRYVVTLILVIAALWTAMPAPAITASPVVAVDSAPPEGWTSQAELIRVLDGDTIEVRVSRKVKIRLLDCWAPERSDVEGPASTANLKRLLADEPLLIHVPVQSAEVEDIWTFGRVLATVWRSDRRGESVNAAQIRQGHATRTKQ